AIRRRLLRPYHRVVKRLAARIAGFPHELAVRLAALPQRRQERIQDLILAVALAAVNVVSLLPYRDQLHPLWLALVLVAAEGIPLIWRRAWPIPVIIALGATRLAYRRIGFGFAPFPLGPAIALYTVIDRSAAVWRWITVVVSAVGVTISLTSPGSRSEPYEAIFQATILIVAWAAGTLSRIKRANLAAAQDRAERAEAEMDRVASRQDAAAPARLPPKPP